MEAKFWKALAGLGVPGVVLGAFYKLYAKFDWPLNTLSPDLVFVAVIVFMLLIAAVVLYTLFLWRPRPTVTSTSTAVSINIPKDCTFRVAAKAVAGDRLLSFEGFSENELSSPMTPRQVTASSPEHLISQLRDIATRKLRPYNVTMGAGGSYIARVI
jgi:hypothetical protein